MCGATTKPFGLHYTITSHISHMATRLKFWWFDIVDTIGDDYHRWYITTDKDIYEYMSVYTCLDWVEETNIFGDLGLGDM